MDDVIESLEIRSRIDPAGQLILSLEPVMLSGPEADHVIVRVEAAPINPSDLGLLIGPADLSTMRQAGTTDRPELVFDIPAARMASVARRIGQSLPVGNEGAGTVVAAGGELVDMVGRKVGMIGGAMYATHRMVRARDCILLPEGASVADGASMFVNPLTALGFVETMKAEGHKAIVHAAAASNLGQMLQRICLADGIPLVNIVRSEAQAATLRAIGATIILDSSAPDFEANLVDAIAETGATLAFDPIGGGRLASQILNAMEAAIARTGDGPYNRYGSDRLKQLYIYGSLDTGPTIIDRGFGFSWSVGGWLLFPFMQRAGTEVVAAMRQRVRDELTTTFASHYSRTIGLTEMLDPDILRAYQAKTTGEKYLVDPTR